MNYYENRGRVPRTDVGRYMLKLVGKVYQTDAKKKAKAEARRTKRGFDGTKTMLSKAKSFVKNIFKRQKV